MPTLCCDLKAEDALCERGYAAPSHTYTDTLCVRTYKYVTRSLKAEDASGSEEITDSKVCKCLFCCALKAEDVV